MSAPAHPVHVPGNRSGLGWRWVVIVVCVLMPLLIAMPIVLIGGWSAPFISFGMLGLIFTAIALPSAVPRFTGQSDRLWSRPERLGVHLPDLNVERPAYAVVAVVAITAPWVTRWDFARSGAKVPGVTSAWLWLLPPMGIGLLFWLHKANRTSLTIRRHDVTLQTTTATTVLGWDELPVLSTGAKPRLTTGLKTIGVTFPAYQLRSDPEVVADVIEFYRTHPQARAEIGTDAFVERLRRGDLAPAPDAGPSPSA